MSQNDLVLSHSALLLWLLVAAVVAMLLLLLAERAEGRKWRDSALLLWGSMTAARWNEMDGNLGLGSRGNRTSHA